MLWQIIFLVTGILSLIYYSAICIALKKWDSTFSRFWLATGIVGIAGSALIRLYGMPCIVEAMIGISVCVLLIAEIKIIKGMHRKPLGKRKEHFEEDTKTGSATRWIIVLGAQVRGRKITDSLKRRLDCASEYLKEHPDVCEEVEKQVRIHYNLLPGETAEAAPSDEKNADKKTSRTAAVKTEKTEDMESLPVEEE